jgi:hypothetical protein
MVKYSYIIDPVDASRLIVEIQNSNIVTSLDYYMGPINAEESNCDIWFKSELSIEDGYLLNDIVAAHSGEPLIEVSTVKLDAPVTRDGRPKFAIGKRDDARHNYYSHNWCDPTTWYSSSVFVVDEIAENIGDNKIYQLDHYNVIDTYHGKIFGEDYLLDHDGYSYRVTVKVNGEVRTEHDPHYVDYSDAYDYIIDYANAKIIFAETLQSTDEVMVTYHYENGSDFRVCLTENKNHFIECGEAQFSEDVEITDSIKYQVFVTNPHYPTGPKKIPYGIPHVYKTITDFQVEAVKAYPKYPPLGGSSWRGLQKSVLVLNWDYVTGTTLQYAYDAEIRIWLDHDKPFGGTYASMTFYGFDEEIE